MSMCQQEQDSGTLPLKRNGGMWGWMTFGPAAGSCSVLLFLFDPADPALAPVSHTHTHTHLHAARHMVALMHTHKHAAVYMEMCKFSNTHHRHTHCSVQAWPCGDNLS